MTLWQRPTPQDLTSLGGILSRMKAGQSLLEMTLDKLILAGIVSTALSLTAYARNDTRLGIVALAASFVFVSMGVYQLRKQ